MQKRAILLIVFFLFVVLSLGLFFISGLQVFPIGTSLIDRITSPLQQSVYGAFGGLITKTGETGRLSTANQELAKKIIDQSELQKEAAALRDQYDAEVPEAKKLLPARVIGMKAFVPGISVPEEIILNAGKNHGVAIGQTVILNNNLIGNIMEVTDTRALVSLITNKKQSLTAKTVKTNAVGIIKGKGNGMLVLENVVLADKLEKGDIVATKGDATLEGAGYPPDLVIGRITSVEKKASDLFQTAEVESLVNFTSVSTVFIITK